MKAFKPTILSILIITCTNSIAQGMDVAKYYSIAKEIAQHGVEDARKVIDSPLGSAALNGLTSLHFAAAHNSVRMAKLIIESAPDDQKATIIMKRDIHGGTPLHAAVACTDNTEMVRLLLSVVPKEQRLEFIMAKVNLDEIKESDTAFMIAILKNNFEMVKLMLEAVHAEQRAALIMAKHSSGPESEPSILFEIVQYHCMETAKIALECIPADERAAFIMRKNGKGSSAFHLALIMRDTEMVKMLLESIPMEQRIAIIMDKNRNGDTALHLTSKFANAELTRMLLESIPMEQRAAVIRDENRGGNTVLHLTFEIGDAEVMRMLLASIPMHQWVGFLMIKNSNGETVIDYAERHGQQQCAQLLAKYCQDMEALEQIKKHAQDDDGEIGRAHV